MIWADTDVVLTGWIFADCCVESSRKKNCAMVWPLRFASRVVVCKIRGQRILGDGPPALPHPFLLVPASCLPSPVSGSHIVVNPIRELEELAALFPEPSSAPLYLRAEHIAKEATPEPYHRLLVHEHHMTISMEEWHMCRVDVDVLASRQEGGLYFRKIVLRNSGTGMAVLFGYVRFNLDLVTPGVRAEILEEKTPLGRVLIQHNVFRHVDLGAILRFTAGPGLAECLGMPAGEVTYGRLATIFCNGVPAIDLLEIVRPLEERS